MPTTKYFSTSLPQKFNNDAAFAAGIHNIFQFEIEGAGTWHIVPEKGVVEGAHDAPDCVVSSDKETFDAILVDSSIAMTKFMEGRITASDLGLGMQLMQFLD